MTASTSTPVGERRVFEARMSMLPETAAFVEAFCRRRGIGRNDALRLVLIVEELFTNSVVHGYGRDCDAPVSVALALEHGHVALGYEDAAPPHDPLAALSGSRSGLAGPLEARPVGRLGIHLVEQLSAHARYAHEDGRNRLSLLVPIGA